MGVSLLSLPAPPHSFLLQHPSTGTRFHVPTTPISFPSKLRFTPRSSSSFSTSVGEEGPPPPPEAAPVQSESSIDDLDRLPLRGCQACGRETIEKGCNAEGRIQGGIATIPGFGWWPIKAYRPCPAFLASGGRYRRRGQDMDEVAFGRGEKGAAVGTGSKVQSK